MAQRLLLADDSITIQKVIELTFADEGIEVVAVGDGDTAIARLDVEHFDVVLADVGMPGRDGFEVAAHLLSRAPEARVPVILLTGAFDPVDEDRVALVGARAVLAKPFEPQVLVAKVREVLASAGTGTPAAKPWSAADTLLAAPPAPPREQSASEYFERLDRAFASLNVPLEPIEPGARHPLRPAPSVNPPPAPQPPPVAQNGSLAEATTLDEGDGRDRLPAASVTAPSENTTPSQSGPADSGLATAFTTLLAVEQGELPASALAGPPAAGDDELVDRVARRVVEQLGDGAVRALAADIVSRTAERLVREEIERIKASIDRA